MLIIVGRRQEKGIEITPPRKAIDSFYWNPSITRHKNEIYVSLRGYTVESTIWGHWRSTLAVGKLVDDKIVGLKVLKTDNPDDINSNRLEDVRIWSDGKQLFAIGNHISNDGKINQEQAEAIIDYDKGSYKITRKFGNPRGLPEKNWSPIDNQPHRYLYSIGTVADTTEDLRLQLVDAPKFSIQDVHNGTPLIKVGNNYIGVFHQRVKLGMNTWRYPNVFIKFDKNLKPIERSGWFVFDDEAHQEVQFISGALKVDKEIWLTVGIDRIRPEQPADYKGLLYKVKLSDIGWKEFDYYFQIRRGILSSPTPL